MSYSCPDCKDGTLVAKVREIELADGETANLAPGRVVISSVGCDNGCSSEVEDEDDKPKRKKRTPATAAGELRCARSELCSKAYAHTGACNKSRGAED